MALTVQFTDTTEDNGITERRWDFGDGSPYSYDTNPEHTYDAEGIYSVALRATSLSGVKTKTRQINVICGECQGNFWNDDFNQPNGSPPDVNRWQYYSIPEWATCETLNGKLHVSMFSPGLLMNRDNGDGTSGDFTVTADYSGMIIEPNYDNANRAWWYGIRISGQNNKEFGIYRMGSEWDCDYMGVPGFFFWSDHYYYYYENEIIPCEAVTAWRFKVEKSGDTLTGYYDAGSGWQQIKSVTDTDFSACYVDLTFYSPNNNPQADQAHIYVDNFQFEQGCPENPVAFSFYPQDQSSDTGFIRGSEFVADQLFFGKIWSATDNAVVPCKSVIRFPGVSIPQNAEIISVSLLFTASYTKSVPTEVDIYAEAADDSAPKTDWNDINYAFSQKGLNSVRWSHSGTWTANTVYTVIAADSGLEAVIQEVISRLGWQPGNALTLLFEGTPTDDAPSNWRTAYDTRFSESLRPVLIIDYR